MLLGNAYNVFIVSPYESFDIADELQITNNVLNNWNRKHANNRKRFFFFNTVFDSNISNCNGEEYGNKLRDKSKDSDLLIALFLTKSGNPIQKSDDKLIKECIEERSRNGKTTLVYFIEKNAKKDLKDGSADQNSFKDCISKMPTVHCESCSEENFEFDLTCDICAFDNFNDTISIEFGVVNIRVKKKKNSKYNLTYIGTFLVNSPEKPIKYRDRVITGSGTIKPEFDLIKQDNYICNSLVKKDDLLEYEVVEKNDKKDELFFTGKIVIAGRTGNEFGFHIPYNAKYLIINVEIDGGMEAYWKEDYSKKEEEDKNEQKPEEKKTENVEVKKSGGIARVLILMLVLIMVVIFIYWRGLI